MWVLLVPVCLAIFSPCLTSDSEPHYVITAPAHLVKGTFQKVCVTFLDLKGPTDIKIKLKNKNRVYIIALKEKVTTPDHSKCYTFQVPTIIDDLLVLFLHVSAQGEHINLEVRKKVAIIKREDVCFIQTDKPIYKPGDIVKFRVVTANLNFQPISKMRLLAEIIDPNKNCIKKWWDVSTNQGFADLSFQLANELALGQYKFHLLPGDCLKYFTVAEYVPRRFELTIHNPSHVVSTDKSFHVEACGSYSHGKPVKGVIDLSVCAEECAHVWNCKSPSFDEEEETAKKNCIDIKREETDSKGCVSRDIEVASFNLSTTKQHLFEIKSKLTEDITGHSEEATADIYLNSARKTVQFVEGERFYDKGFPYDGKVKVSDEKKQPVSNEAVTLYIVKDDDIANAARINLVTDLHGIAQFTLKTSDWPDVLMLKARLASDDHDDDTWNYGQRYTEDVLWLLLFYSYSESLLSIQEHSKEVTCNSEQSVTIKYDIQKKNLNSDTHHLHFFYMLISKGGISSYKEHKEIIKDQANRPNLQGSFPINFHVDEDFFPKFGLLVFSVLPNGETIAKSTDYNVPPCKQSKIKLSFSEEQVRPGENVNLEIRAEAGSLCSARSEDKGYLLKNPHTDKNLILDMIERLRHAVYEDEYTHLLMDPDENNCPENTSAETDNIFDVYKLFTTHNLQILTNTAIKEPVKCVSQDLTVRSATKKKKTVRKATNKEIQKHLARKDFSDTWLYELVPIGSDGHTVLNRTTPHTITKWVTDAFCLGTSGISSVGDVELTTFQPYFIDLILPYSVVQGEKFTIQTMVFSYVKKCILIAVSLSSSEDLVTVQNKEQTRCVCEGYSHMFSWDVSATKPKTLKIHVDSSSTEMEGECTADVHQIGEDHRKDSVEKTIVIKPRGYEEQKTKTFLLLPSDNRESLTINIDAPEKLVEGSERANIIVLGNLLANIIVNLDDILHLPEGCGEQNVAKIVRYDNTLEYLETLDKLTPETKAKITKSLVKAYQTQLTFRNERGFYASFPGGSENLWLTAFTLKAYKGAGRFVYIDRSQIQEILTWLRSKQRSDGCFTEEGDYYNNKVDADDLVTPTAYVTIALLEHYPYNSSFVEYSLSCLRKSVDGVTSAHTQALLAYVFSLSGDTELRDLMLKKLDERAVKKDGLKHWKTDSYKKGEIETASYVILALIFETRAIKNLEDSVDIVRWLVMQQNPFGGFYSSQDTAIALQALAKYAKAINSKEGNSTVTIRSKSGFEKMVHGDKSNSLLVQTVDLPKIPGEYTVSVTGNGFVYLQSHLLYHVLPEKTEKGYFSFNVNSEPSTCTHTSWKRFDVHIDVSYSGKRVNTNMAMIIVESVSGYVPDQESVKELEKNPLVERTEVSAQNITIYLTKLTHEPEGFVFTLEQEAPVQNLQPATAMVFDYYDPDERTVVEYSAPCNSGFKKT